MPAEWPLEVSMKTIARFIATLGVLAALAGCVVYDPYYPYGHPSPTASFDRSWNAAVGALQGEGVTITQQDRGAGIIAGSYGGTSVTARVLTQADGRVRVEFNTSGGGSQSQQLSDRISRAYEYRMGR
jgi:hypothetical protein